jgi:uncharacterized membrane protein
MKEITLNTILTEEKAHLQKLHQIVNDAIQAEELIIKNLAHPPIDILTNTQKLSDKIARFGGSWQFIISFFVVLVVWIVFNVVSLQKLRFDPYPFILMNLILSCIAALQAPIIMMSQIRQEEKDRKRSENDYLINLKAEMQIQSIDKKMNLLLEEEIKTLFNAQDKQISLLKEIINKLDKLHAE